MDETMWKDALDYFNRRKEVSYFYGNYEDILRMTRGYPRVNFRYTVAPTKAPPNQSTVPIYASREEIDEEIEIGYQDGLKAIRDAKEDGTNVDNLLAHLRLLAGLEPDTQKEPNRS